MSWPQKLVGAASRRAGAAFLMARGISARKACKLVGLSRSSLAYQAAPSRNEELRTRMRELAEEQPRLGCRMAWAQLREEFSPLNLKRVRRLWLADRLNLRRRRRGRIRNRQKPDLFALRPNQAWCMDFAHDACLNGTKLKCLAVVDEYTRESLAIEVSPRLPSRKVLQVLEAAISEYGLPECIRCDNGPEFIYWHVRLFLKRRGIELVFIQAGSPWQNGFAESFIGTFRDNCLDVEVFRNLADAQVRIEAWRKFYNESRPHSGIGYFEPRTRRERFNKPKSAGLAEVS